MSSASVHSVHIPVMGTGFTIDTPLKVARFGISSVVSLVDDVLIEQMRRRISQLHDEPFEPIENRDDDSRARRITSYLDLLDRLVKQQVARLRESVFTPESELTRYYEMLPHSPLRSLYERMQAATDSDVKTTLQEQLRKLVVPGSIDVNIMTKLDADVFKGGQRLSPLLSSAMSALRGFAQSKLSSSVVLSAGLNRRLFRYFSDFDDFFPGRPRATAQAHRPEGQRLPFRRGPGHAARAAGRVGLGIPRRVRPELRRPRVRRQGQGPGPDPGRVPEGEGAARRRSARSARRRAGRARAPRGARPAAAAHHRPGRHRHARGGRDAAPALPGRRHRLGHAVPAGARGDQPRPGAPPPPRAKPAPTTCT